MSRRTAPACLAGLLLCAARGSAQELPDGFVRERIASFGDPLSLAYIDQERLLVAERSGRVWFVEHDAKRNVVYDIQDETLSNQDRGLFGIAAAPDFDLSGWIYLLYVTSIPGEPAFSPAYSRVIRVRAERDASGDLVALPETREVLLGDTWATGIPSCASQHTLGTMRFLSDGSLVLATGDNALGLDAGGLQPACFEPGRTSADQDLGAFRAQYEASLCGKVLRIDPGSGLGLPDNPFYTGDPDDLRSRVYARGLRNPFRFTLLPGSGPREALLVGDVGDDAWEEINLCLGGENFGWPCFEGPEPHAGYRAADARGMCSGAGQTAPILAWHHSQSNAAGFVGRCASALCVYEGERYPAAYRGRLFFFDFERAWLRTAQLDDSLRIQSSQVFGTQMGSPVELVAQPGTGDLVYVAQGSMSGALFRLRYVGDQQPPVAVASATPSFGPGPLDVTLDGTGSSDPDGQALDYAWDLGDGTTASGPVVTRHYPVGAAYTARLTVTDPEDLSDSVELRITPGNTPPRIVELLTPRDGDRYVPGEALHLAASAEDAEDGTPAIGWSLDRVHDHHVHPGTLSAEGASARVVPEAHGTGDEHFVVRLSVSDSSGLVEERALEIYAADSGPRAHLVELPSDSVRVGQALAPIGHVDFAASRVEPKLPSLTWDWGDGTADVFRDAAHHVDTRPVHVYRRPGTYSLRLVAELGAAGASIASATIRVAPALPAVAVFAALDEERWIARAEQEEIVATLAASLERRTSEVRAFRLGQGARLAAWMEALASDPLHDVVVLLDFLPRALAPDGIEGSLLERWVEQGNAIVWTGSTPFQVLLQDDGTSIQSLHFAEALFGATLPDIVFGSGHQYPTPLGQSVLPALTGYASERALRLDQLGPAWRVARLFAADGDLDSDALELEHVGSGGSYAQFLCAQAAGLPRAAVLSQFLLDELGKSRIDLTLRR